MRVASIKHDNSFPANMKRCPGCGVIIENISKDGGGGDIVMCGSMPRSAGGNIYEALANGGCGHEFNFKSLAANGTGSLGNPANER
jgi:hypothetical protein